MPRFPGEISEYNPNALPPEDSEPWYAPIQHAWFAYVGTFGAFLFLSAAFLMVLFYLQDGFIVVGTFIFILASFLIRFIITLEWYGRDHQTGKKHSKET